MSMLKMKTYDENDDDNDDEDDNDDIGFARHLFFGIHFSIFILHNYI